ncbi:MAG: hypothetical protein JEZ04_22555 [Spirochaetales bacterium]|nr:hypothetical protein [Spirochaetales bacterium]
MNLKSTIFATALIILLAGCSSVSNDSEKETAILAGKAEIGNKVNLGWDSLYLGNFNQAKTIFNDAINKDIPDSRIHRGIALAELSFYESQASFDSLVESIEIDPLNSASVAAAGFLQSYYQYETKRYKNFISILEKAVSDRSAPEWLKREYRYIIFDYYYSCTGKATTAKSLKENLGIIQDWSFIGPFSNISGSGFCRDFIPFTEDGRITKNNFVPGKNNWEIEVFTPELNANSLLVPASGYFSNLPYSSIYAFKEVEIDKTETYRFVFSRRGAFEAWIDGEKVVEDGQYTQADNVFYINRALDAGIHEIVVKCSNLESYSGFNVSVSPVIQRDEKRNAFYNSLFPDSSVFDPFLNNLCAGIDDNDYNPDTSFWLLQSLLEKGWNEEARRVLSALPAERKDSSLFIWQNALIDRALDNPTAYEQKMLKLAEGEFDFAPGKEYALLNYILNKRFIKAELFIEELREEHDNWSELLEAELLMNLLENENEDAFANLSRIEELYPENANAYLIILKYGKNISLNKKVEIIKALYSKGEHRDALYYEFSNYSSANNHLAALKLLKDYLENFPVNEGLWIKYIELLYEFNVIDYEALRERISEIAQTFPLSYEMMSEEKDLPSLLYHYYSRLYSENIGGKLPEGLTKKLSSEKEHYRDALKKLIKFYPQDLSTRDELRKLLDQKEFGKEIKIADSYTIIEKYKDSGHEYEDCDAVIVRNERKEVYFGDGASATFQHFILKVQTKKGVEDNRYQYLEFNPAFGNGKVVESYILKDDGSRIQAERSGRKLAFPGLSTGDFIVIYYSVESYVSGEINNEIYTSTYLKSVYPIYDLIFDLIYPEGTVIQKNYNNITAEDEQRGAIDFIEGYKILHYASNTVMPVETGAFSPDWRDIAPWIDFSTISGWDKIIQWYQRLYLGQTRSSDAVVKKTEEVCGNLTNPEDKIKAVFNFVSSSIEYEDLSFQYSNFIPQSAESVLRDGYGDCKDQSALLIAMLKAAGIESYIALSNPGYTGPHELLPSPRFSHAIVVALFDDEKIYLDPTTQYFTYGEIPASMEGTYVLDIIENGSFEKLKVDTEIQKTYTLLEIEDILHTSDIKGTTVYQGLDAGRFRASFIGLDEKDSMSLFSRMLNTWMPGFTLASLDITNLNSLEFDPTLDYTGSLPSLVSKTGNGTYKLNLPWADIFSSRGSYLIGTEDGADDIRIEESSLSYPEVQTIVMDIPDNYSVSYLPDEKNYEYGDCYLRYSYKRQNKKLICSRAFYVPAMNVPAAEIATFRIFIKNGLLQQQENVYLKRM